MRPSLLPLATLLLLTACDARPQADLPRADLPPAQTDTLAAIDGNGDWQQCDNEHAGVVVSFPAGWRTNDGSVMPACSLFDPEPFVVPVASEIPEDIAVSITAQEVAFEVVAGSTFGLRVISSERRDVAGRNGITRLVEHTGEGLHDRGLQSWQYIVDWGGGRTLIAESHSAGEPPFDAKRRALDAMMHRLQPR